MREKPRAEKRSVRYDGAWRDRDPATASPGGPAILVAFDKIGSFDRPGLGVAERRPGFGETAQ